MADEKKVSAAADQPEDSVASSAAPGAQPVAARPYEKPRIKLHGNLRLMTQLD